MIPLAILGVLAGHEVAYALTSTPHEELHAYMRHLPQVALLLAVLSLVGASFVQRGGRLALWPFPAVAVTGFVAQEHIERLAHDGSVPFLLDQPVFLVGLAVQVLVAVVAWLIARLLVRIAGTGRPERQPGVGDVLVWSLSAGGARRSMSHAGAGGPRAPPFGR